MNYELLIIGRLLINTDEQEMSDIFNELPSKLFRDPVCRSVYEKIREGMRGVGVIADYFKDAYPDIEEVLRASLSSRYAEDSVPLKEAIRLIKNNYICEEYNKAVNNISLDEYNADTAITSLLARFELLRPDAGENIQSTTDLLNEYKDQYFIDKPDGFMLELGQLGQLLGQVDPGSFLVIAARTGIGKSALALQILRTQKQFKGLYVNIEISKNQIFERLVAAESGIDMTRIRKAKCFLNDEKERYDKALEKIKTYNFDIISGRNISPSEISSSCRNKNYDYVLIDYLQLLKIKETHFPNRREEVDEISKFLRFFALETGIIVIAISQLNRVTGDGIDKEPTTSEIRESGSIEQDATDIILLWGSKDEHIKNAKLAKTRTGIPGKCELYFDGPHMTFIDAEEKYLEDNQPFNTQMDDMKLIDPSLLIDVNENERPRI